ncbi:MAG: cyanophycinase [Bacteroidales bacterium]|nr:cyanophycinase [Bacteroidales bacterium]
MCNFKQLNNRLRVTALIFCLLPAGQLMSQEAPADKITSGPSKGTLVIAGGGRLSDTIIKRFISLAGGDNARIVYIPTAAGAESYSDSAADILRSRGAGNVTMLHTDSRDTANSDFFTAPLLDATGVWFGGGRQWRLVDSYGGTLTEELFRRVLERGGVIGGSSAGATIQGSFLARGDTENNQVMMGDHQKGFCYISNIAIDQHVLARNRQFDMYGILREHPELLGIGIDENTAVVVQRDTMEVIGASYVLVYDGSFWSREGSDLKILPEKDFLFYLLRQGDRYNLRERKIID